VCALGAGLGHTYRDTATATAAPEPAAGAYRLRNLAKNLCLRIGAKVAALAECDGSAGQTWRVDGNGQILNATGSDCLEAGGNDGAAGQPVGMYRCLGQADQKWALHARGGNGAFEIHNAMKNTCLDVDPGTAGATAKLAKCAGTLSQRWIFEGSDSSAQILDRQVIASRPTWLTPDLIKRAIERHAPILYLHPEEKFLPATPEWFLERATLHDPKGGARPGRDWLGDLELDGDGYWFEIPESARGGDLSLATAYVHARPTAEGSFLDLQFWTFYPYNGGGAAGLPTADAALPGLERIDLTPFGTHTGDWEVIILRLRQGSLDLAAVGLAAHGHTEWRTPAKMTFENGRPVYYASRNGHGAYAQIGANPSETILRNDTARGHRFDMRTRYRIIGDSERPFNLPGRWGPLVDNLKNIDKAASAVPSEYRGKVKDALKKIPERESNGPESMTMKSYWLWAGNADAYCGDQKIRDAQKCGETIVVDKAKCGVTTVQCGYETITSGARCGTESVQCGWDTFTSVAKCGSKCVTSGFSKCSCKLPRYCNVEKSCQVPKMCEQVKSCAVANECTERKICPIR
jgi:hypothetical protein